MAERQFSASCRLRLAGALALVVGLLAAVWVYMAAAGPASATTSYQIVGGQVFAVEQGESRREEQQIERLGGKAAVLTLRFQRWFDLLWQGRRLAFTLAALCSAIACGCFWVAGLVDDNPADGGR